ncbi:MAG: M20/M25/M40 family metallo-hydrolase [Halorhodospira sp.]
MTGALDTQYVAAAWDREALPALTSFIRIPAKSPSFDPAWAENGHLDAALELGADFCRRLLPEATVSIERQAGRTPLLFVELPGSDEAAGTALIYGHLDKQPESRGWSEGLAPWEPVIRDGRLYGRGAVDDGYALFSAVVAVASLREAGQRHPRCVFVVEACEESGSLDLPAYLDALAGRIGQPGLIVCPDAGCGTYDRLWCTTSLRGMITGTLRVDVLSEGVHSGDAGGVVPSSFRLLRRLLSRLEDPDTGQVLPQLCGVAIPELRRQQAAHAGTVLGELTRERYPLLRGVGTESAEPAERILDRSWRPALEIVGAEGLPPVEAAGNVLRPFTATKIALRLPPTANAEAVAEGLQELLTEDPPSGARVAFEPGAVASGWEAPEPAPWLSRALERASCAHFGAEPVHMGEGGTIPLINWLQARFPQADYLVTGVAGPGANAHGPDESLHLDAARRLTACLGEALHALAARDG